MPEVYKPKRYSIDVPPKVNVCEDPEISSLLNGEHVYCPLCLEQIYGESGDCTCCGWKFRRDGTCIEEAGKTGWPMYKEVKNRLRKLRDQWIAEAGKDNFPTWCRKYFFTHFKDIGDKLIKEQHSENNL